MKSIGFKEWSLVCDALGRGEQTVILRKGGLAEGRGGFSFRHREFFLFPTFFHEQIGKVRSAAGPRYAAASANAESDGGALNLTFSHGEKELLATVEENGASGREIVISFYATVERAVRIDSLETAEALARLHVLTPEVVRERFAYKSGGLNVAFIRVFRLEAAWVLPNEKRFGGCRSWIELPAAPEMTLQPVLDEAAHAERRASFDEIVRRRPL